MLISERAKHKERMGTKAGGPLWQLVSACGQETDFLSLKIDS